MFRLRASNLDLLKMSATGLGEFQFLSSNLKFEIRLLHRWTLSVLSFGLYHQCLSIVLLGNLILNFSFSESSNVYLSFSFITTTADLQLIVNLTNCHPDYFKAVNVSPKSLIILRSNDLGYLEEAEDVLAKHFERQSRAPSKNLIVLEDDQAKENAGEHGREHTKIRKNSGNANESSRSAGKPLHYDLKFLLAFQNKQFDVSTETRNLTKHLRIQRDDLRLDVAVSDQDKNANSEANGMQQNSHLQVPGHRRNRQSTESSGRSSCGSARSSLESSGKVSTDADTGEYRRRRDATDEDTFRPSCQGDSSGSFENAEKPAIETNSDGYRRRRQTNLTEENTNPYKSNRSGSFGNADKPYENAHRGSSGNVDKPSTEANTDGYRRRRQTQLTDERADERIDVQSFEKRKDFIETADLVSTETVVSLPKNGSENEKTSKAPTEKNTEGEYRRKRRPVLPCERTENSISQYDQTEQTNLGQSSSDSKTSDQSGSAAEQSLDSNSQKLPYGPVRGPFRRIQMSPEKEAEIKQLVEQIKSCDSLVRDEDANGMNYEDRYKTKYANYDNRPVRSVVDDQKLATTENGVCDQKKGESKPESKPDAEQKTSDRREQSRRRDRSESDRRESSAGQSVFVQNETEPAKKDERRPSATFKRRITGGINEFGSVR